MEVVTNRIRYTNPINERPPDHLKRRYLLSHQAKVVQKHETAHFKRVENRSVEQGYGHKHANNVIKDERGLFRTV